MSRTSKASDEGFTLVEVMIAMVVFLLFSSAGIGMLVGALRTSAANKNGAAARQLAQADFEKLKGLVFQAASGATLLSTYYPDLTAATGQGTRGYVAPATTRYTADGDPGTGAFYRTKITTAPASSVYTRYLTLQFVDNSGSAVTPPTGYLSSTLPLPAPVVRATETVVWNTFGRHIYTLSSELTTGRASSTRSSAQARMVAVRITGLTAALDKVSIEGPSITQDATLTDNAVAAVGAKGAEGVISSGGRALGAVGVANAPADETAASTSAAAGALSSGSSSFAAYGPSTTNGLIAKASYATPLISTSALPATATLATTSSAVPALTMSTLDAVVSAPAKLQLSSPTIAAATAPACGGCTAFTSTGWLSTSDTGVSHAVNSSVGTTGAAGIGLFPTSFAPQGVVILKLASASLTCHAGGTYPSASTPTATATYSGTVQYWNYATSGYVTKTVSQADSTSPLAGIPLATTQVATYASAPVYLSDYIASWSSATSGSLAAKTQTAANNKVVSTTIDGFLNITTAGVRTADPSTSSMTVQLGIASCAATDAR